MQYENPFMIPLNMSFLEESPTVSKPGLEAHFKHFTDLGGSELSVEIDSEGALV